MLTVQKSVNKSAPKGSFGDFLKNISKIFFAYFSGIVGVKKGSSSTRKGFRHVGQNHDELTTGNPYGCSQNFHTAYLRAFVNPYVYWVSSKIRVRDSCSVSNALLSIIAHARDRVMQFFSSFDQIF